jgi:hypothetical protein
MIYPIGRSVEDRWISESRRTQRRGDQKVAHILVEFDRQRASGEV